MPRAPSHRPRRCRPDPTAPVAGALGGDVSLRTSARCRRVRRPPGPRPGCGCSTPASASWAARCWPGGVAVAAAAAGQYPLARRHWPSCRSRPPGTWCRRCAASGAGSSGAALLASRLRGPGTSGADLGVRFRWIDLLGIPIGVVGQCLVALIYVPIAPHVHDFHQRFAGTGPAPDRWIARRSASRGHRVWPPWWARPFFEELFFRGVLLRALARLFGNWGGWVGPALAIVVSGVLFGLAHARVVAVPRPGRVRGDPRRASPTHRPAGHEHGRPRDVQPARPHRRRVPRAVGRAGTGLTWPSGRTASRSGWRSTTGGRRKGPDPPRRRPPPAPGPGGPVPAGLVDADHPADGVAGVGQRGGRRRRHRGGAHPTAPEPAVPQHHHRRGRHRAPTSPCRRSWSRSLADPRAGDRMGPGVVRRVSPLHLLLPVAGPGHRAAQRRSSPTTSPSSWSPCSAACSSRCAPGRSAGWPGCGTPVPPVWPPPHCRSCSSRASRSTEGTCCPPWPGSSPSPSACRSSLLFLGVVAAGLRTGRHRALAAVLFAATLLCHLIPAIFAAAGAGGLAAARRRPPADVLPRAAGPWRPATGGATGCCGRWWPAWSAWA